MTNTNSAMTLANINSYLDRTIENSNNTINEAKAFMEDPASFARFMSWDADGLHKAAVYRSHAVELKAWIAEMVAEVELVETFNRLRTETIIYMTLAPRSSTNVSSNRGVELERRFWIDLANRFKTPLGL